MLPKSPIPSYFTSSLREKLPPHTCNFTTNPCRIKYFTQEIVIHRDDILNRMRRQCVIPPTVKSHPDEEEEEDVTSAVTEHLVKTVLDQGKHWLLVQTSKEIWKGGGGRRLGNVGHCIVGTMNDGAMIVGIMVVGIMIVGIMVFECCFGSGYTFTGPFSNNLVANAFLHLSLHLSFLSGHLCPLPLNQVPIRWSHDASLRLYPLPDLLLMADHYDQYVHVFCHAMDERRGWVFFEGDVSEFGLF